MNEQVCARCEHRQRPCRGKCVCTIDGRDVRDHVAAQQCPLDRFSAAHIASLPLAKKGVAVQFDWKIVGPKMWVELDAHVKAFAGDEARFDQWFKKWLGRIGCGDCKIHAVQWVASNPPTFSSLYAWRVAFQNSVNVRLGKPQWSVT